MPTGYQEQGCCLKGLIRLCVRWLDEKSSASTDVAFSTVRRPSPCMAGTMAEQASTQHRCTFIFPFWVSAMAGEVPPVNIMFFFLIGWMAS